MVLLVIILAFTMVTVSLAPDGQAMAMPVEDVSMDDHYDDDPIDGISDWFSDRNPFSGVIEKIQRLIDVLQELISGDLLYRKFCEWVSAIMDNLLRPLEQVFDKNFLSTPSLTAVPGIHQLWSNSLYFSLGLIGLAILLFAFRAIQCQDFNALTENGKVLGIATVAIFGSLWICEFFINVQNRIWSEVMARLMVEAGVVPGESGVTMLPIRLIFGATGEVAADEAVRMVDVFGTVGDVATAAAWMATPSLITNAVGYVIIGMLLLCILGLLLAAKFGMLLALAVAAPLYLSGSAVIGRMDALVGWVALFFRTLLVQSVCCMAWYWMIMIQLMMGPASGHDLRLIAGVSAFVVNLVLLMILIYVIYRFWLCHAWVALRHPLTLNGAVIATEADRFYRSTADKARSFYRRRFEGDETGGHYHPNSTSPDRSNASSPPYAQHTMDISPRPTLERQAPSSSEVLEQVVGRHDNDRHTIFEFRDERLAQEASSFLTDRGHQVQSVRGQDDQLIGSQIQVSRQQSHMAQQDLDKWVGTKTPYWEDGNDYITLRDGLHAPVAHPEPPANGIPMGRWRRQE